MNAADLPALAADLQAATTGISNVFHQLQQQCSMGDQAAAEAAPYLDQLEKIREALVGSNQGQP